ncbi:MAG: alanine racemase [bacterium]|nr:alanine racemase [bacterium]
MKKITENNSGNKSWIELSENAFVKNVRVFRKLIGNKVLICGVVKANAYGHGLGEVAQILKNTDVDWFAVDSVKDALLLRDLKTKKPVLILGYINLSDIGDLIRKDISFVVYNIETLKKIVELNLNKKAKIHLKIETGLNRQGVEGIELKEFVKFIKLHKDKIVPEGISMHFANIEDTKNPDFAKLQLKRFKERLREIEKQGVKFNIKHAAASAGIILYPDTHLDMVRVGIGLYGLFPSKETIKKVKLFPALSWKSIVAQIKTVDKGESVGYGRTWFAHRKSKIAVIPVGYFDGYDRKLSNRGKVIIKGLFASVVGRICMNMFMVDVTDILRVKLEDEVVLVGKQERNQITADELAEKIGTINYEVMARINPGIPRVII